MVLYVIIGCAVCCVDLIEYCQASSTNLQYKRAADDARHGKSVVRNAYKLQYKVLPVLAIFGRDALCFAPRNMQH